jgi:hypothetical protein
MKYIKKEGRNEEKENKRYRWSKNETIHQFRPISSLFVQKTIKKEVCIVINPNIRQTIFQPKV